MIFIPDIEPIQTRRIYICDGNV